MHRLAFLASALILAGPIQAQQTKLSTFAFEGVSLTSSLAQFKLKKPDAQYVPASSEKANGLASYVVANSKSSSGAMFNFLDDKLYNIRVLYQADRINKMGGADQFYKKLVAAFGEPSDIQTNDKAISVSWSDGGSRSAQVVITDSSAALTVTHGELEKLLNQRRARNTNLGF